MEILFKVLYAIVILTIAAGLIVSVISVLKSQVDLKETVRRWFRRIAPGKDVIATRDPNAIYQDGSVVGSVTGAVEQGNGMVVFRQLAETSEFRRDQPFEYGRQSYRVLRIGSVAGMKVTATPTGLTSRNAVLEDVVCEPAQ